MKTAGATNKKSRSEIRLRRLSIAILAAGFGAAITVYLLAGPRPENPLGYEPLETKQFVHDLEVYGGKANVLATEFREWFTGLWYGRNLAYTVAAITVLLVLVVRFFATPAPGEELRQAGKPAGSPRPRGVTPSSARSRGPSDRFTRRSGGRRSA